MKTTGKRTTSGPSFDADGYQKHLRSLNGEPLPDLATDAFEPLQHGGRRPGAGRRPSGNQPVLLRLPPRLIKQIRRLAKVRKMDNSRVAAELLLLGLDQTKA